MSKKVVRGPWQKIPELVYSLPPEKPIVWVGTALSELRGLPEEARRRLGYQLHRLQLGFEPVDWKPVASVGVGVYELRIHEPGEYRVFSVARFPEALYVLHSLEKKERRTPRAALDLVRRRYRGVMQRRTAQETRS
ncbi:MAG TPA: type II toxin-antitoxin system RelE/ParE family toxin [Thermoanaerobaculia bacterium]|nr:type II toxin-antitoxin system RelE/ParE family toxin [Thermoanaerobaculia bacterium]